jgi:hypothetical protein
VAFELEDQHHRGHGLWFATGTVDQFIEVRRIKAERI